MAMKEIEFSEDQLHNLQDIALQLFSQTEEPGTVGYQRQLLRPRIRWAAVTLHCVLPPLFGGGFVWLLWPLLGSRSVAVGALLLAAYYLLTLKRALICAVRIYQRLAPASIRNKCRFEPSCSQYMILSLEKYGIVKGLAKGVGRLKRCNIKNGGFDLP